MCCVLFSPCYVLVMFEQLCSNNIECCFMFSFRGQTNKAPCQLSMLCNLWITQTFMLYLSATLYYLLMCSQDFLSFLT